MQNQITEEIAADACAHVIVICVNGPTTINADRILSKKGITVVLDILANEGRVVVSYFEGYRRRVYCSTGQVGQSKGDPQVVHVIRKKVITFFRR